MSPLYCPTQKGPHQIGLIQEVPHQAGTLRGDPIVSLAGADLSKANLNDLDLKGANLIRADPVDQG